MLRKDFPASNSSRCLRLPFPPRTYWTGWPLFDNKTGVLYYSWYRTQKDNENRYLVDNVQKMINSFSSSPVFTLQDVQTKRNFAGGYYVSPEDYAQVTANTIEMILSGKDCKEISTLTSETPEDLPELPTPIASPNRSRLISPKRHLFPRASRFLSEIQGPYHKAYSSFWCY